MNFNKLALNIAHFLPPEMSNKVSLESLKLLYKLNILEKAFSIKNFKIKPTELMGLSFPNKIGVAGGLDKNANYFHILGQLGFGFVEVGTITLKPQKGNPKPRIHRFAKDKSIVNSLGFNNVGVFQALKNIEKNKTNFKGILGVSLGKGKEILNERAHEDYLHLMDYLYDVSDYLAINISSPNTADLRKLSSADHIEHLTKEIGLQRNILQKNHKKEVPIFLKLSPDEEDSNIEKIISTSLNNGISGFIISNTTIGEYKNISGGISGKLLKIKSLNMLKRVKNFLGNESFVISSGGISDKSDLTERLDNGAKLAQIYTSFVYQGPKVVEELLN